MRDAERQSAVSDHGGRTSSAEFPPPWLDRDRYPFDHSWHDGAEGAIHYVDAGTSDDVVVAIHGNPTWSFMYRGLLRELPPEYRVVAPDHLGFGLSAAPDSFSYRPSDQAAAIHAFLDALDVSEFTLVVHDWGGPIGLSYAMCHPERVRSLVVANTFCWPARHWRLRLFGRLVGGAAGRVGCEGFNAFPRVLMPIAFADRSRFPASVREQYVAPLSTHARRRGTWRYPRAFVEPSEWLESCWQRRDRIADIPTLITWGLDDPVLGERTLDRFTGTFQNCEVAKFHDVGHYVPEEAGDRFVRAVRTFLKEQE